MQNDLVRAVTFADHALRSLPEKDSSWRPGVYVALGDAHRRNGQWEDAKSCYRQALAATHSPALRFMSAHIYGALADLDLRQGRLRDADEKWRKALASIQDPENWGRLSLPLMGWVYIRTGEVLYERNELHAAWDHVSRGLEYAEMGGDVRALIAGTLLAGRVQLTEGDVEAAAEYLERARPLVEQAAFAEWTNRFARFQLELWLAQDRLRTAVQWADAILQDDMFEERPESEAAQLAMARVLIVKGDAPSVERALALLEELRQAAEAADRTGVTIEALALQALARWHPTWLSGRDTGRLPFRIESRAARLFLIPLVLKVLFHRVLTVKTPIGRKLRPKVLTQGGPLIRLKPKDMAAAGIERVPKTVGVRDGMPQLEDGQVLDVSNVIWCTGFQPGFSWIDLPIFGEYGPKHERGIATSEPGLYFIGLHFLYAMSSGMIHGVERDAEYIVQDIVSRESAEEPRATGERRSSPGYAQRKSMAVD